MIPALFILISIPLVFFLPGFLICKTFFEVEEGIEMLCYSLILSLFVGICLGLLLGLNATIAALTGGFTAFNIAFYTVFIDLLLMVIYVGKELIFRK